MIHAHVTSKITSSPVIVSLDSGVGPTEEMLLRVCCHIKKVMHCGVTEKCNGGSVDTTIEGKLMAGPNTRYILFLIDWGVADLVSKGGRVNGGDGVEGDCFMNDSFFLKDRRVHKVRKVARNVEI